MSTTNEKRKNIDVYIPLVSSTPAARPVSKAQTRLTLRIVYPPPPRRSKGLLNDLMNLTQFACPTYASVNISRFKVPPMSRRQTSHGQVKATKLIATQGVRPALEDDGPWVICVHHFVHDLDCAISQFSELHRTHSYGFEYCFVVFIRNAVSQWKVQ